MTITRAEIRKVLEEMVPKSKQARRTLERLDAEDAAHARRVEAVRLSELARRIEQRRQADAARLSDEAEAKRFAPFRPALPPPPGRLRPVLDVGTDDHAPPYDLPPPPPRVFDVGEDL